jgi:hypothetical protein
VIKLRSIIIIGFVFALFSCYNEKKKSIRTGFSKQKNKPNTNVDSIFNVQLLNEDEQFIDTLSSPICISSYTYDSLFNKDGSQKALLYGEQTDDGKDWIVIKINHRKVLLLHQPLSSVNGAKLYSGFGISLILAVNEDNHLIPPDEFTSYEVGTMEILSKKNRVTLKIRGSGACD